MRKSRVKKSGNIRQTRHKNPKAHSFHKIVVFQNARKQVPHSTASISTPTLLLIPPRYPPPSFHTPPQLLQFGLWVFRLPTKSSLNYFKTSDCKRSIGRFGLVGCNRSMKRASSGDDSMAAASSADVKMKRIKMEEEEEMMVDCVDQDELKGAGFSNLDDNLIFEVFKHVDARTLGMASCVSKQWHKTAEDERLWELICTRHWANIGCGNQQLRSVVLALGGFRRLHSLSIWPFSKPSSASSSSAPSSSSSGASSSASPWATAPVKPMPNPKPPTARWGKDEVNLSLSLLSIRFYEKMNYANRGR